MEEARKHVDVLPEQEKKSDYEAPEVLTYSGEKLLETLGPARACGASVPACPISD